LIVINYWLSNLSILQWFYPFKLSKDHCMKRNFFLFLLAITACLSINSSAQVTSLSENFNTSCGATTTYLPGGWSKYSPPPTFIPYGEWGCSPDGEASTPGVACTNFFSGSYHIDTSYLFTPALNLSGYTHVYLHFDTKTSKIHHGARFSAYRVVHADSMVTLDTMDALAMTPVISNSDSSDWVTHELDLSGYVGYPPIYIAFRYASADTNGSVWYLDNVNTSTASLNVARIAEQTTPVNIVGNATNSQVTVSFNARENRNYRVMIYDMLGREYYQGDISAGKGVVTRTITGLNLSGGFYFLKMSDGLSCAATRFFVP